MEKEPVTKFFSVLVSFHVVIKLQSSEFSVSDVIHGNVQNISVLIFFAIFFCYFYGAKASYEVLGCF